MSFFLTFDDPLPEHKKDFDRDDIGSSIAAIRQEGVVKAQSKDADDFSPELKAAAKGSSLEQCLAKKDTPSEMKAVAQAKPTQPRGNTEIKLSAAAVEKQKSNSTSTMFVQSTISVPDVDRILLSVSLLLEQMICDPTDDGVDLFNPVEITGQARIRTEEQCRALHIFRFMKESFDLAMWSPECNIIALVLITRLIGSTEVTFNFNNWDKILLCALLLAQKLWDDTPLANVDFPAIWQCVYPNESIDLSVINQMEKQFLMKLHYDVHVSRSTYTQFYFELRELSEQKFPLEPLSDDQATKLEANGGVLNTQLISLKDKTDAKFRTGNYVGANTMPNPSQLHSVQQAMRSGAGMAPHHG